MMRNILSQIAAVTVLLVGLNLIPTKAVADENAARAIISQQLESFLAGDFENAYSYASPNIKRLFPTLNQFMSMVQSGYLPVLRPGNYAFGRVETAPDGRVLQEVTIRAPDGSDWTALYYMQQQEDGSWKVDGVSLRKGAAGLT
ncbi:MAG: DUF4864 domain-containing protein [Pseudomonadota bacterium]